jgi:hypothetical protein
MRHRVVVTREGSDWLLDVPGVQGAHSQSDDLRMLDRYAREVALDPDLQDEAMADLEFDWVIDVSGRDLRRALGPDWSLRRIASMLNAPAERVTYVPPGLVTRFRRRVVLSWWTWRHRRALRAEGDDDSVLAGEPAAR